MREQSGSKIRRPFQKESANISKNANRKKRLNTPNNSELRSNRRKERIANATAGFPNNMPADFDKCVKEGGKVRRVSGPNKEHGLKAGEYVNYCMKDGKSHRGYVKKAERFSRRN